MGMGVGRKEEYKADWSKLKIHEEVLMKPYYLKRYSVFKIKISLNKKIPY